MSWNITVIVGLAAIFLAGAATKAYSQGGVCGDAPVVEDGHLKGELDAKAQFLSRFIGDAGLKGNIEIAKNDVLSRYPNADKLRLNQYFLYTVCVVIMADRNMPTVEKLSELRKARDTIFAP